MKCDWSGKFDVNLMIDLLCVYVGRKWNWIVLFEC